MINWTKAEIKKLRLSKRLSQAEFAEKLGVAPMTVSRWERGVKRPRLPSQRKFDRLVKK
ncbi:MAG: helix-turn-helix domain-containing protein [Deltaproteobacteria bacterium]|nr:helix-turn-helix domain-containing protein [Deltaproteobacteria bacterium]